MDALRLFARQAAQECTKDTCPASASIYGYAPNFNATVAFIIGFAISTLIFYHESFVWPKWRFYSLVCAVGCLMEAGGYVGRLMLHNDPFSKGGFKINVILLTIAPAFISAGIYVTLKKLVLVFGTQYSRLSPNQYAYIFVSSDIVSIILQGVGGSISAMAKDKTFLDQGVDIMIAGLVSQVFTLFVFAALCVDFGVRCYKNRDRMPSANLKIAGSKRFRLFAVSTSIAFLCIFIRCCYRVAELCDGWGSEIMRKEGEFIILDSDMCMIASVAMSIFHPGYFFIEPELTYVEPVEERWPGGAQYEKSRAIPMRSPSAASPVVTSPILTSPINNVSRPPLRPQSSWYSQQTGSQQLQPPPPLHARYECWEDRRSWI